MFAHNVSSYKYSVEQCWQQWTWKIKYCRIKTKKNLRSEEAACLWCELSQTTTTNFSSLRVAYFTPLDTTHYIKIGGKMTSGNGWYNHRNIQLIANGTECEKKKMLDNNFPQKTWSQHASLFRLYFPEFCSLLPSCDGRQQPGNI